MNSKEELYQNAKEIAHWHSFSDEVTDKKPSNMTIEEAESIIYEFECVKIK